MQVYTGIDWSENKHDIVFKTEAGASIAHRSTVGSKNAERARRAGGRTRILAYGSTAVRVVHSSG
jgi:hypothetical protein